MALSRSLATMAAVTFLSVTAAARAQQDPSKDSELAKAEPPLIRIQAVLAEAGDLEDEELQAACAKVKAETIQAIRGDERPGIYTLNSKDVTRFLAALEKRCPVQVMSRPSILCVDGQIAEITVGQQIAQAAATRSTAEGMAEVVAEDTIAGLMVSIVPTAQANDETKIELIVKKSDLSGKVVPAVATGSKKTVSAAVLEASRALTTLQTPSGKTVLVAIKGKPSGKWFDPTKTTLILLTPKVVERTAATGEILHH